MTNTASRIEYIDLAKGLCILLVVYFHAASFVSVSSGLDEMMRSFRMPLYFFLSGFFFKPYGSFREFLIRKTNRLLIPFAFFYLTTSVILPYIFSEYFGHTINTVVGIDSLWAFLSLESFPNIPIWFLWCLFLVNLAFYGCHALVYRKGHGHGKTENLRTSILCLLLGLAGFTCQYFKFDLHAFLDETLAAMPFFCTGFLLRKQSRFLQNDSRASGRQIAETILLVLLLAAYTYGMTAFKPGNYLLALWVKYTCGICGTLMVILIAKVLKKLPLVSYFGHYSIMILCTHTLIIQIVVTFLQKTLPELANNLWIILPATLFPYLVLIPLMKRIIPWFTAQKDLIRVPPAKQENTK